MGGNEKYLDGRLINVGASGARNRAFVPHRRFAKFGALGVFNGNKGGLTCTRITSNTDFAAEIRAGYYAGLWLHLNPSDAPPAKSKFRLI